MSAVDLIRGAAAAHGHWQALQAGTGEEVLNVRFIELSSDGPLIAVGTAGDIDSPDAKTWLDRATFTLTEDDVDDRRVARVASTPEAVAELTERARTWLRAAAIGDDVLRSIDPMAPAYSGVITESLAYSTL